jgi:hypothetical protein
VTVRANGGWPFGWTAWASPLGGWVPPRGAWGRPLGAAVLMSSLLIGCARPATGRDDSLTGFDRGEYHVLREHAGGFTLGVLYSRHQFHPDTAAVTSACRQMLTKIARELAEVRDRRIKPIDESRIKLSVRRDSSKNVTSCAVMVPVEFAE